ncbi:MAG: hypothetical protein CMN95_02875 [Synechococcus sp. MED650]|nr:hypothetical protein [Synechococcus sp. MED650]MEC8688171.1 hypothetical protein [Cyanobacteriota bacterium]OUW56755.1 MAG: hypothetical protein CBD48_01905 [Cyanobacteria bacterium TMED188]
MGQHHDTASGTLATLVTGAVIGAASLAWWLLNEADRRRRYNNQKAMLYAPRMQDGSEVFESSPNGHLEERVEKLNAEIARVRAQLEGLGNDD